LNIFNFLITTAPILFKGLYMVCLSEGPLHSYNLKLNEKFMKFTRVHYQNLQFLNLLLFSKNSPCLLCVTVVQVTLVTEICLKSAILTTLVAVLITCDVVNKIDIYTLLMNWQYNSACKISILFSESQILKKVKIVS
jgi:hypothetical protein